MSHSQPSGNDILKRMRADFLYYAPRCLKIRTKAGKVEPLNLNRAQLHLHAEIERQIAEIGKARVLGLKGRQQGFSTYAEGRMYWKTSGEFGKQAYILTHEQTATDNLFGMVKRYHENCPAVVRPNAALDNAKELYFDRLDTRYKVATAGARATGRSATAQYFHGSEIAFWPSAEDHMAGLGQTVPDMPGTEIILESTANGTGNLFHAMVMRAMRGEGEYRLVFVPWFWQDEYRKHPPGSFRLDTDERDYAEAFALDDAQMFWRRMKITDDFAGDINLFNQEYPATIELAFTKGSDAALISSVQVAKARITAIAEPMGALVIGVDPAEYGDDKSAIVVRKGRKVVEVRRYSKVGTMTLAGIVAGMIDLYDPDAVNVDVTGVGTGVADRLLELGYGAVNRIHPGGAAIEDSKYRNKRAEMWGLMKEWFDDEPCQLPDDDALQADLTSLSYSYDSSRRLVLESKERLKALGLPSPDSGDALGLTFALPVRPKHVERKESWRDRLKKMQGGSPMAA